MRCLIISFAMLAAGVAVVSSVSAAEPIQPVRPVQDINLAQVELGKLSDRIQTLQDVHT